MNSCQHKSSRYRLPNVSEDASTEGSLEQTICERKTPRYESSRPQLDGPMCSSLRGSRQCTLFVRNSSFVLNSETTEALTVKSLRAVIPAHSMQANNMYAWQLSPLSAAGFDFLLRSEKRVWPRPHPSQGETSYKADYKKGSFGIGSGWGVLSHNGRRIGDSTNERPIAGQCKTDFSRRGGNR